MKALDKVTEINGAVADVASLSVRLDRSGGMIV